MASTGDTPTASSMPLLIDLHGNAGPGARREVHGDLPALHAGRSFKTRAGWRKMQLAMIESHMLICRPLAGISETTSCSRATPKVVATTR